MTEREQRLFDLGQNFPGLLTDEELAEWARLRDRAETQPTAAEQAEWSEIMIIMAALLILVAL